MSSERAELTKVGLGHPAEPSNSSVLRERFLIEFRSLLPETLNMQDMRSLLAEEGSHLDVGRLDDHQVLERAAHLAAVGRLFVVSRTLPIASVAGAVSVARAETPAPAAEPIVEEDDLTWVAVQLEDEEGNPVPGERYRIELSDGEIEEGDLDQDGKARVSGIPAGECKLSFPDLDKSAWEPA